MSLVDDIAGAAGDLLGSGESPAAPMVEASPITFLKADPIDPPDGNAPGAAAPNSYPNVFDPKIPIEFIHFGHVHVCTHDTFPHPKLGDSTTNCLKNAPSGARAIMFRAALVRETLLIHGFIRAAKRVVEERAEGAGAVEELASAASSLMGGGGPSGPLPQNFDPYLEFVETAGGSINKSEIQYTEIHQAGIDLNQARANFNQAMPKLLSDSLGGGGEGLFGGLTDAIPLPDVPGVGDVLKTITGILFKMHELHQKTYEKFREKLEPAIASACHARSLAAIQDRHAPVFDVWSLFPPPPEEQVPEDGPEDVVQGPNTGVDAVDGAVDSVNQAAKDVQEVVNDVEQGIENAQKAWERFWDTTPEPGPGEEQLNQALNALEKPGELLAQAFADTIGIGQLPDPIKVCLVKIVDVDAGMLRQIYLALQSPVFVNILTETAMLTAARKHIFNTLQNLLMEYIPGFNLGPLTSDMAVGKGFSTLDEYIGEYLNPIIGFLAGSLHQDLVALRKQAVDGSSCTLEVFLAAHPLLLSKLVRNTFFPFWQLLADEVFKRVGAGAALAASPVKSLLGSMRSGVADAKEAGNQAGQDIQDTAQGWAGDAQETEGGIQDTLADYGMNVDTPVGEVAGAAADAVSGVADDLLGSVTGGEDDETESAKFPGGPRESTGKGVEIKKSEWKDVQDNQAVSPQ